MRTSRAQRAAGFTLLEVMLAMTSLAMLTAIIYGAFHLGTRALEKGQNAVVVAQRLRAANDVLVRQVKSMVAYPARNEDEGAFWYFKGNATTMQFVTAAGLQGGGGLVEATYTIDDGPRCGGSGPCLLLTENPHISPDSLGKGRVDRAGARTAVVLDGFRHMSFEYWDPDEKDPPGYASRWNPFDNDRLPPAVRISVDGLPGVASDTVALEIPVNSFQFSGTTDPEELMGEAAQDKESPQASGADTGKSGASQAAGENNADEDAGDAADDKDDK
jgi:type II secretory pathway pseudopilin PulG